MDILGLISFAGAALCAGLAVAALWVKRRSLPWLLFGLGMLLLAADSALSGLTFGALSTEQVLLWQKVRLRVVALLPGTWLAFSLCYSRGNFREFLKQWRLLLLIAYAAPVAASFVFGNGLVPGGPANTSTLQPFNALTLQHFNDGEFFISLGMPGKILNLVLLGGSVMILMNFERTFRSAVGVMR